VDILRTVSDEPGFFTRAQAHDCGYDDKQIAAAVRSGEWIRFRRGYYCLAAAWRGLDEVGRHLVRCRAVLHSLGPDVALSHVSSSAAHEQDIWGQPLDRVQVTRLDNGAGRIEGDVVHHVGRSLKDQVVEVEGMKAVQPVRAAIEAASRVGNEAALCHLDAMLRAKLGTEDDLMRQFNAMERWPFTQHLHVPVRMASHRSGSIGESRGMWFFYRHGIPKPTQQFEVLDHGGLVVAICDWGWPDLGALGEFDGKVKYGRLLKPGQEPGDVVFAEKRREDLIRELTGLRMIRLVWDDYAHVVPTVRRLRSVLRLPA
jgi:hypothetical protein